MSRRDVPTAAPCASDNRCEPGRARSQHIINGNSRMQPTQQLHACAACHANSVTLMRWRNTMVTHHFSDHMNSLAHYCSEPGRAPLFWTCRATAIIVRLCELPLNCQNRRWQAVQARAQRHGKVVQPDLVRARVAHVLAVIGVVLRSSTQTAW